MPFLTYLDLVSILLGKLGLSKGALDITCNLKPRSAASEYQEIALLGWKHGWVALVYSLVHTNPIPLFWENCWEFPTSDCRFQILGICLPWHSPFLAFKGPNSRTRFKVPLGDWNLSWVLDHFLHFLDREVSSPKPLFRALECWDFACEVFKSQATDYQRLGDLGLQEPCQKAGLLCSHEQNQAQMIFHSPRLSRAVSGAEIQEMGLSHIGLGGHKAWVTLAFKWLRKGRFTVLFTLTWFKSSKPFDLSKMRASKKQQEELFQRSKAPDRML